MTLFEILKYSDEQGLIAHRVSWSDMWIWCSGIYDSILVCVPREGGGEYCFPWNPDPNELLADDWEVF